MKNIHYISGNDIDKLVESAIWYMNIGIRPELKTGEQVIVKFYDGTIGYYNTTTPQSYKWNLNNIHLISAYAIFDIDLKPVHRGVVRLHPDSAGWFENYYVIKLVDSLSCIYLKIMNEKFLLIYSIVITLLYWYNIPFNFLEH
jgi:hypothetical protein